jgi:signal transduction histidine kinase
MLLATCGVLALLALSFRQSDLLRQQLVKARRLSAQNHALHQQADRARLYAAEANEQVLNLVGAELHDGPVQLLDLMALMDQSGKSRLQGVPDRHELTERVLTELRNIATGLILPELSGLSITDVVTLAITRHKSLVAQGAAVNIDTYTVDLDMPRKICLYRIVQEGLTNAFRHSDGRPPKFRSKRAGPVLKSRSKARGVTLAIPKKAPISNWASKGCADGLMQSAVAFPLWKMVIGLF